MRYLILTLLLACSPTTYFQPVSGESSGFVSSSPEEVRIQSRNKLENCDGVLLGVLHTHPNIIPYEVSRYGGNYYIRMNGGIEVWSVNQSCVLKGN